MTRATSWHDLKARSDKAERELAEARAALREIEAIPHRGMYDFEGAAKRIARAVLEGKRR